MHKLFPFGCRSAPKSSLGAASVTPSGWFVTQVVCGHCNIILSLIAVEMLYILTRFEPVHDGVGWDYMPITHHCQVVVICQRRGDGIRTLLCSSLGGT